MLYTTKRISPVRPEDSHALPGMESADEDRAAAAALAQGEALTAAMQQPGRNINSKAGKMERDSPLFYGTGENPTLF